MPAVASRGEEAFISSRPVGGQLAVQSCVIKGPVSTPSRSSSVSIENLLAVHAGSLEGQRQVEDVGVEGLQPRVSLWAYSPSPIAQRPAATRNSSRRKEGDHEKRTTTRSSRPPKKCQKVEMVQVMKADCLKIKPKYLLVPLPLVPIVLQAIICLTLARNGACLKQHPFIGVDPIVLLGNHRGARGRGGFGHRTQDRKCPDSHGPH